MKGYLKVKSFPIKKKSKTFFLVLNFHFLSFDKKCFVCLMQFAALVTKAHSSVDFLVRMPRYNHELT